MIVVPLRVGEKLKPKPGLWIGWHELELIHYTVLKGTVHWWTKMTSKGTVEASLMTSFTEKQLREGWERKGTFFRVGKTYKMTGSLNQDTYRIIELHLVDDPIDKGNGNAAAAVCTSSRNGKNMLSVLTGNDFPYMEEVQ